MNLFAVFFVSLPNMKFNCLVTDNHLIFNGKFLKLCDKLYRLYRIDSKDSEKYSDKKGKRKILRQSFQFAQNMRVNQEIIRGSDKCPQKRKFRTDDPLNISPLAPIIPKADMRDL